VSLKWLSENPYANSALNQYVPAGNGSHVESRQRQDAYFRADQQHLQNFRAIPA
jgi:hypothetical protein